MATLIKPKKVTHPLDEEAKTRLIGGYDSYVSSGSEHSGYGVDDSPCLSELIQDFFQLDHVETTTTTTARPSEPSSSSSSSSPPNEPDSTHAEQSLHSLETIKNTLKQYLNNNADPYKKILSFHVTKAVGACSCVNHDKQLLRRNVMLFLRRMGYNAAVCKTRWDTSGGLTAGSYEFIDIVNSSTRYFIDIDFACEFEIARATDEYVRLLKVLPSVYVGVGEELKNVVKLMCDQAKRSLKKRQLSLPPWRKNRFMQNKWFASYLRTVNSPALPPVNVIMCRQVGFDDGVSNRLFVKTR